MKRLLLVTTAAAALLSAPALAQSQSGRSGSGAQLAPSTSHDMGGSRDSRGSDQIGSGSAASPDTGANRERTTTGESKATDSDSRNGVAPGAAENPDRSRTRTESDTGTGNSSEIRRSGDTSQDRQKMNDESRSKTAQQPAQGNAKSETAQRPSGDVGQRGGREQNMRESERESGRGSVNVSEQQRTRLNQSFARLNVRPLNDVNFSVSVGAVVPRDVRLEPLPAEIVDIVPQYRGYEYFAVRDEIVIVEPATSKVVLVLPRSGSSAAVSSGRRVVFSDRDREVIRKHVHVRTGPGVTTGSAGRTTVIVGDRVPDSVEIRSFPEEVYEEAPALKEYRYIEEGDRTYVVEPRDRRVIEEID